MKRISLAALAFSVIALGIAGADAATCSSTVMTSSQIQTLLAGNTACVGHTPNAQWSEWHNGTTSGNVVDWKLGPTDPKDPTSVVGTFQIRAKPSGGQIIYSYPGGYQYAYVVYTGTSNPYTFCNVADGSTILVTVNPGQGAC